MGDMTSTERLGGRPAIEFDLDEVEKLGALQCTYAEVANWFGCSEKTIKRRSADDDEFREALERGKGRGRVSLRRTQFRMAEKNAAMAIFLGKQFLGQEDKTEVEGDVTIRVTEEIIGTSSADSDA